MSDVIHHLPTPEREVPHKILYGPPWPDPKDVPEFLEQVAHYVRAAAADDRHFQAQRAIVLLVDDRGRFKVSDVSFAMNGPVTSLALDVSKRRLLRELDPAPEDFDYLEPDPPSAA